MDQELSIAVEQFITLILVTIVTAAVAAVMLISSNLFDSSYNKATSSTSGIHDNSLEAFDNKIVKEKVYYPVPSLVQEVQKMDTEIQYKVSYMSGGSLVTEMLTDETVSKYFHKKAKVKDATVDGTRLTLDIELN